MRAVALALGLALVAGDVRAAAPRGYAGALAVPTEAATTAEPVPTESEAAEPLPAEPVTPERDVSVASPVATSTRDEPPPPRPVAHPSGLSGRRLVAQRVGVAAVVLAAGGWVATIVGLGLGSAVDSDLAPLRGRDEIDRRRELLERGRLANRLALGAGISAGVMLAVGVTLLAVARRQRPRSSAQARAAR